MKNRTGLALMILLGCWSAGTTAQAASLELVGPTGSHSFTLKELQSRLKTETLEIDDPVYHQKMTYDVFALGPVLELLGGGAPGTSGGEVVFTAKDGYAPNASLEQLAAHHGYLAYQEHGKGAGHFGKVAQGKAMISPAPFYVVWKEGAAVENEVPWPYALVKIELVSFKDKYPHMFPKDAGDSSAAMKGFLVFKAQCVRCHSINLEGGDLGPELNAPKNVTEYWAQDTLKAYIKDATSFRYKDKMPPFPNLSGTDIDNLVAYLAFMKDTKVKQ